MPEAYDYRSQVLYARLAGFMYIFIIITYIIGDVLTSRLEVPGNFSATAHQITANENSYRFGIYSQFITSLFTIFLAIGLYVAVRPVNKNLALIALAFRLAEATIGGACFYLNYIIVQLYTSGNENKAFSPEQLSSLVKIFSGGFGAAYNLSATFFAIGSVIFFYLFYKGYLIPKALSAFGLITSLIIIMVCFIKLVYPQYAEIADYGWHPMGLAEIVIGIWLLIKGVGKHLTIDELKN